MSAFIAILKKYPFQNFSSWVFGESVALQQTNIFFNEWSDL